MKRKMLLIEASCHKCLGQVSQGVKKAEVQVICAVTHF